MTLLVRKAMRVGCEYLGQEFIALSKRVYQDQDNLKRKSLISWCGDKGDQTLRLQYELNEDSLVFDVGGYQGQWASDIFSIYQCSVFVFEPIAEFAEFIRRRFFRNTKIRVYEFGLSDKNQKAYITVNADGSSIYRNVGVRQEKVSLVRADDFIVNHQFRKIDLMKINIEGGEYVLLQNLLESGIMNRIYNIQVQFHDFLPGAEQSMQRIQRRMEETHILTYQYPFVWENWKLNRE